MATRVKVPKRQFTKAINKSQRYWNRRGPSITWNYYNKSEKELQEFLKTYDKYIKKLDISVMDLLRSGNIEDLPGTKRYKTFLNEVQDTLNNMSKEEYNYLYRSLANNINSVTTDTNKSLGIDFNIKNKELDDLLKEPWVTDGKSFSDRIWANKADLKDALDNAVTKGIAEGQSPDFIARAMQTYIKDVPMRRMVALARTETMHFLNVAQFNSYAKAGVTEVNILAAEDERMCDVCERAERDGPYKMNKAPSLPLHTHCRCCYIPVVDSMVSSDPKEDKPNDIKSNNTTSKEKVVKPKKAKKESFLLDAAKTNEHLKERLLPKDYKKLINFTKNNSIFDDMLKEVIVKMDGKLKILDAYDESSNYYTPLQKGLVLTMQRDVKGMHKDKPPFTTLFHEWGHLIDDLNPYKSKISSTKAFTDAIEKDFKKLEKDAKKWLKDNGHIVNDNNIGCAMSMGLGLKGPGTNGIQDIIGGMSDNRYPTMWGHSTEYWNRKDKRKEIGSEMWAHMTSAHAIPEAYEAVSKFMPNTLSVYKQLLKNILDA